MRRRPNRELTEEQEQAADDFISGASEPPPSTSPSENQENRQQAGQKERSGSGRREPTYPWEESHVREDVKQTYPLRLPEPLHLKLKFLSEKTGKSMNELCNEAVREMVEERLDEIL